MHGIRCRGVSHLRFDCDQWDAVHKKNNVENDTALHAAWGVDTELIDRVKNVSLRMRRVNELHHRIGLTRDLVDVRLSLEEELLHRLVCFQKSSAGMPQKLISQVVELPAQSTTPGRLSFGSTNEPRPGTLRAKAIRGGSSVTRRRTTRNHPMSLIHHRPAQRSKLVQEWLLDVKVFRHGTLEPRKVEPERMSRIADE